MFSVIIPLYNKSQYIENCLKSVLNQTFDEFEIIVINDGSTDGGNLKLIKYLISISNGGTYSESNDTTKRFLIKKFQKGNKEKDCYIEVIFKNNLTNMGVSAARNIGAEISKYQYISFLDADDWWHEEFLEQMKVLIFQNPEAGIYGCSYFRVKNTKTRPVKTGLKKEYSGYINYFRTYSQTFQAPFNCSFVVTSKSAFFERGKFNESLKFGEDFELWVRIALKCKVAYLNEPLAYSNQDSEKSNRAVGNNIRFNAQNHYIFNLEYLTDFEIRIPELKILLDGLRVRSLRPFYLSGLLHEEVSRELKKVNMSKQPITFKIIYSLPIRLIKIFFCIRKKGSSIKKFFQKWS